MSGLDRRRPPFHSGDVIRPIVLLCILSSSLSALAASERPNVLWITAEDLGPHLAFYGDTTARTPNLDELAARSLTFERAWSNAPVCAPARTAILTGVHPPALGALDMRTMVNLPEHLRPFPLLLREAGYYCTNRSKTDYNVAVGKGVWDASSGKAHWRNRPEGAPFFAVVNLTITHEGQVRNKERALTIDPEKVPLPDYFPDLPEVREDVARYYSRIVDLDRQVGEVLADLEEDGLTENTIIVFYGDHGPGLPRSKREPYDSGLRVPMTIHVPERFADLAPRGYEEGTRGGDLVSFVDLAPTMLSLAGIEPPEHLHGRAFAGHHPGKSPSFLFGYRDRMDERLDLSRVICDGRWLYRRNFMPDRSYGQHVDYQFETPTTQVWFDRFMHGGVGEFGAPFWSPKPCEELYDLDSDPSEVNNLAALPEHAERVSRMRAELAAFARDIRDLGFVPEPERLAGAGDRSPWDLGVELAESGVLERVFQAAEAVRRIQPGEVDLPAVDPGVLARFGDDDPAVRCWAAMSARALGAHGAALYSASLSELLKDPNPSVRVIAAEVLAAHGDESSRETALEVLLELSDLQEHGMLAVHALNAIDRAAYRAIGRRDELASLPRSSESLDSRMRNYVPRLLEHIEGRFAAWETDEGSPRTKRIHTRRGSVELAMHVQRPAGNPPPDGWPAVVFFHGGGWRGGSPDQFFPYMAALAEQGIVGLSAQYRLESEHGTGPFECVEDGRSAMRWVRARAHELGIDPRRIAAGGGSAGGHVAAAIAAVRGGRGEIEELADDSPAALLLFNPVIDNGPGGYGHGRLGDRWMDLSPMHADGQIFPPTLFLLGTEDSLIPVETGRSFTALIEDAGGECELVLYEGAGHGFFNPGREGAHHQDTVERMLAFLSELGWIGG